MHLPIIKAIVSVIARAEIYRENDMWRLCFCIIIWNKYFVIQMKESLLFKSKLTSLTFKCRAHVSE